MKLDYAEFVCMLFICLDQSCVGFIMPLFLSVFALEYIDFSLLGKKAVTSQKSNNIMITESCGRWRV